MSSKQSTIPPSVFNFLGELKQNNHREWFNTHKEEYQSQLAHVEEFVAYLLSKMNEHDVIETPTARKSMHRIYRDTRFSKDKTPYKPEFSGSFTRATKFRRGSYYFRIEPGNSFVAGGFWGPVAADMKLIRDDISFDPSPLRKILTNKQLVATFGNMQGEQLKTAPKGYDPDHKAIDLLRYKQYLLIKHFTDKEVLNPGFADILNNTFKVMRPFLNYMTEVLTLDGNGA